MKCGWIASWFCVAVFFSPFFICSFPIRVLLQDLQAEGCSLRCSKGFIFHHYKTKIPLRIRKTCKTVHVRPDVDRLRLEGVKQKVSSIVLQPRTGLFVYNNREYRGKVIITYHQGSWKLINSLDFESYIYGVLRTEGWPGWPIEAYKVLAITCRSYALHQILRARASISKAPFHIKDTNSHQTYQGNHDNEIIRQAVSETEGIFLGYEGKPILAMFDACCGGIVPANISREYIDFFKAPYLSRSYACTFCKSCKIYQWRVQYKIDELIDILQEESPHIIDTVADLKLSKDKAGVVQKILVKTKSKRLSLTARHMYALFNTIKSFVFSLQKKAKTVIIKGRGFGHHIGLCQWGARQMIKEGWTHRAVLQFYYPKTAFMRIQKKDIPL